EAQNGVAEAVAAVRDKLSPPVQPKTPNAHSPSPIPSPLPSAALPSPALAVPSSVPSVPPRRTDRRFWRVDREGEDGRWLCLDPLDEARGRKVLDSEGLCLDDAVRY
ncbi:hypothetical protein FKP32DRAFT_1761403, partial [Trametes sanguinea]